MSPKGVEHTMAREPAQRFSVGTWLVVHSSMSPKGVEHPWMPTRPEDLDVVAESAFINVAERR